MVHLLFALNIIASPQKAKKVYPSQYYISFLAATDESPKPIVQTRLTRNDL